MSANETFVLDVKISALGGFHEMIARKICDLLRDDGFTVELDCQSPMNAPPLRPDNTVVRINAVGIPWGG